MAHMMMAWLILTARGIASWVEGLTDEVHLRTDPACRLHRPPRPGSRLADASHGEGCMPCMRDRAFYRTNG